jgi:hypothetical protein
MKSEKKIQKEKETIKVFLGKIAKEQSLDVQEIDLDAIYDATLSISENMARINEHLRTIGWIKPDINMDKANAELDESIAEYERQELAQLISSETSQEVQKIFWEFEEKANVFFKSDRKLFVVTGESGIGKSHQATKKFGQMTDRLVIIRGVLTPAELNDTLAMHSNGEIIILDDTDNYVNDAKAISILKSATEKPYTVKWGTKDSRIQYQNWINKSKIVMIMNSKPSTPLFKPLFSRAYTIDIKLNYQQKMKLLVEIAKQKQVSADIIDFLVNNTNPSTQNLNIRTLEKIAEFYQFNNANWKALAMTEVKANPIRNMVLELATSSISVEEQVKQFREKTNGSRAKYFRIKKSLGIKQY